MNEPEFTPGPWKVHPMAKRAVHQPRVSCWIPDCEADALLIAAAPDMYKALTEVLNSDMAQREEDEGERSRILKLCRYALAKARGERD